MHTYFDPDKSEEHRLAVHLFRHKLMHTGSLRYLYDREHNIKYTWRIFFGEFEWYQVKAIHYTITDEDDNNPGELATLIPSSGITNSSIRALNVSIPRFVENLRFTLFRYLDEAERDTNMRQNMELSFSHLQFHEFN